MSKIFFEIDQKLKIIGRGSLMKAKSYLEKVNLANCLRETVLLYNKLNESYLKSMSNDGEIVGLERSEILKYIDSFLSIVILSNKSISANPQESRILIGNEQEGFFFKLRERDFFWEAEGKLTQEMISPAKNFYEIFNSKLSAEIKNLLNKYRDASLDRHLDSIEITQLQGELNKVLYFVLYLRLQVERCLVNK